MQKLNFQKMGLALRAVHSIIAYSSVSKRREEAREGGVHIGQFLIEGGVIRRSVNFG